MAAQALKMGMPPVHPGEFVRTEILGELGLSIAGAARHLKVRAATLSDLVNEKASLSPEMALRLELAFNVKAELLLRLQAAYDTVMVRARAGELDVQPYAARPAHG